MSIPSNPVSDSAIANDTILNALTMACAPTLCTLSNPDRADQEVLGPYIIDA